MKALYFRILKDNWKKVLVYSLIGLLFVLMYASMFPSLQDQAEEFSKLLKAYPPELMKVFGIEDGAGIFDSFEGFLGMEHFSMIWPLLTILASVSLGTSLIAYEVERKTIQLLLAQPISRAQLFITKYIAGTTLITLFAIISIVGILPITNIWGIDLSVQGILLLSVLCALFGVTIFSVSLMFSSFAKSPTVSTSLTSGVIFGMYALNLVASLKENLSDLKYFSYFHYFDYQLALVENELNGKTILVFLLSATTFAIIGLWQFQKRDI